MIEHEFHTCISLMANYLMEIIVYPNDMQSSDDLVGISFQGPEHLYRIIKRISKGRKTQLAYGTTNLQEFMEVTSRNAAYCETRRFRPDLQGMLHVGVFTNYMKEGTVMSTFTGKSFPTHTPNNTPNVKMVEVWETDLDLAEYFLHECVVCEKVRGLRTCSECNTAKYCGEAHQKDHWTIHKLHCTRLKNL